MSALDRLWLAAERRVIILRRRSAQLDLARRVQRLGSNVTIGLDCRVIGGELMTIGDDVHMGDRTWLQTVERYAGTEFAPSIVIGDGVTMEDDCHIGAIGQVEVGPAVLIATGVLLTDHKHSHADIDQPVRDAPLRGGGLRIGAGSHIGQNACVIGPVTVGRHCVIGANAVVTRDVPDYTVVVGAPARAISRYDESACRWVPVG